MSAGDAARSNNCRRSPDERRFAASASAKLLVHGGALLIALACFAAYGHFKLEGQSTAAMVSLASAAVFGFTPLRGCCASYFASRESAAHRPRFGQPRAHRAPVSGVVSSRPVLTRAWMAPFAMMGAAQAVMHQNNPRNAKQAAALKQFATSLPEVAQFAGPKDLVAANAKARRRRAVRHSRQGASLGRDRARIRSGISERAAKPRAIRREPWPRRVDVALRNLSGNPAAQSAVPDLEAPRVGTQDARGIGDRSS